MADYSTEQIETALENSGEIIVTLDSDGYAEPPELHLHDTTFDHEQGQIMLSLADGQIQFPASAIESVTRHQQTTEELGL